MHIIVRMSRQSRTGLGGSCSTGCLPRPSVHHLDLLIRQLVQLGHWAVDLALGANRLTTVCITRDRATP